MADLNNLLNEAKFILAKATVSRNESRLRGEQFNIFHACGVNHYETKHSAIIAEFLNPEGSHGQGDIYLKEFLATFGENEMLSSFDSSTASVTTEYAVPNGRLDLLITNIKKKFRIRIIQIHKTAFGFKLNAFLKEKNSLRCFSFQ